MFLIIIAYPFVLALCLITFNYYAIKRSILFLRYGGEFIPYEKDDKITIKKIYDVLKETHHDTTTN